MQDSVCPGFLYSIQVHWETVHPFLKSDFPMDGLLNLEYSGVSKIVPWERGNPKWFCCACMVFLKCSPVCIFSSVMNPLAAV